MNKLLKLLAAAAVSASLTTGLAVAQTGSISNTGPDSENDVTVTQNDIATITNENNVGASNRNQQSATSGEAEVEDNTTGGNATSGNASNANTAAANVTLSNSTDSSWSFPSSGDPSGSISNTGPDSDNEVTSTSTNVLTVTNTNNVELTNCNNQDATSGEAEVEGNTTGGNATSGDASNSNSNANTISG